MCRGTTSSVTTLDVLSKPCSDRPVLFPSSSSETWTFFFFYPDMISTFILFIILFLFSCYFLFYFILFLLFFFFIFTCRYYWCNFISSAFLGVGTVCAVGFGWLVTVVERCGREQCLSLQSRTCHATNNNNSSSSSSNVGVGVGGGGGGCGGSIRYGI